MNTPIQEALKAIKEHESKYKRPSSNYELAKWSAYTTCLIILESLLSEERMVLERAFDIGYNNCLLGTGIVNGYPYETTGVQYFNNTYCNEKTT